MDQSPGLSSKDNVDYRILLPLEVHTAGANRRRFCLRVYSSSLRFVHRRRTDRPGS